MLNASKIPAKSSGPKIPAVEAGTYPARLVQVILIGTQKQQAFKGEEKPPAMMFRLTYELLDEFMKDADGNDLEDKPRWLTEEIPLFSLKADLAKSTKRYYALDPNSEYGGDWVKLLGAPCMVTVVNYQKKDGTQGDKVASVATMRAKEASKAPELKNPTKVFDFYEPDMEVFDSFPEWLQEKIKEAVDFDGSTLQSLLKGEKPAEKKSQQKSVKEDLEDDIPEQDEDKEDW